MPSGERIQQFACYMATVQLRRGRDHPDWLERLDGQRIAVRALCTIHNGQPRVYREWSMSPLGDAGVSSERIALGTLHRLRCIASGDLVDLELIDDPDIAPLHAK